MKIIKIENKRQLRRALTGSLKGLVSSAVLALVIPLAVVVLTGSAKTIQWLIVPFIIPGVIGLCINLPRVIRGYAALNRLSSDGQIAAVIADFNSDGRLVVCDTIPENGERVASLVLGEDYIFILDKRRVVPYREVVSLRVEREPGISFLRMTDTAGKTFLLTDDLKKKAAIQRCIEHIKARCPVCPEVETVEYRED